MNWILAGKIIAWPVGIVCFLIMLARWYGFYEYTIGPAAKLKQLRDDIHGVKRTFGWWHLGLIFLICLAFIIAV